MGGLPWRIEPDGLALSVRLTPKGGRDALDGVAVLSDGKPVLKARVRAAPQDGEANAALTRLIAGALAVPSSQVSLSAGATARIKTFRIAGDGERLAAALSARCMPERG